MDTRTGTVYPNKQAAIDAGVPEDSLVEYLKGSGPFKGRIYLRDPKTGNLVRVK